MNNALPCTTTYLVLAKEVPNQAGSTIGQISLLRKAEAFGTIYQTCTHPIFHAISLTAQDLKEACLVSAEGILLIDQEFFGDPQSPAFGY